MSYTGVQYVVEGQNFNFDMNTAEGYQIASLEITSGTAILGEDFTVSENNLNNILVGASQLGIHRVWINMLDDGVSEQDETFYVHYSGVDYAEGTSKAFDWTYEFIIRGNGGLTLEKALERVEAVLQEETEAYRAKQAADAASDQKLIDLKAAYDAQSEIEKAEALQLYVDATRLAGDAALIALEGPLLGAIKSALTNFKDTYAFGSAVVDLLNHPSSDTLQKASQALLSLASDFSNIENWSTQLLTGVGNFQDYNDFKQDLTDLQRTRHNLDVLETQIVLQRDARNQLWASQSPGESQPLLSHSVVEVAATTPQFQAVASGLELISNGVRVDLVAPLQFSGDFRTSLNEVLLLASDGQRVQVGGGNVIVHGEGTTGEAAILDHPSTYYSMTRPNLPDLLLGDPDGHHMIFIEVDRVEFTDGRLAYDIDGTNGAGAAYRIYQAAFDRTPDIGGLTFWTEQADKGMSTIEMAARFIDSNEFRNLYGSSSLPADTFVDQVYENVLHRAGEQAGVDYWVGQIHAGMSEAEVLARFADSAENRADVVGVISNGIWLNPEGDYAS